MSKLVSRTSQRKKIEEEFLKRKSINLLNPSLRLLKIGSEPLEFIWLAVQAWKRSF